MKTEEKTCTGEKAKFARSAPTGPAPPQSSHMPRPPAPVPRRRPRSRVGDQARAGRGGGARRHVWNISKTVRLAWGGAKRRVGNKVVNFKDSACWVVRMDDAGRSTRAVAATLGDYRIKGARCPISCRRRGGNP